MKSVEILVMVVLGGMGSMLGSVLSATVLDGILPEALRAFSDYRMLAYSHRPRPGHDLHVRTGLLRLL